MGNSEPIGSGRRFRGLENKLAAQKGVKNPTALAAAIGIKKFGKGRMAQLAQAGKNRAAEQPAENQPPRQTKRVKV